MGALSKSSSMVDSPTVWELPDARPSPGGLGLRKVENMKTARMSLEAREDREDGYSPNSQRRAAIEFRARKGWRVVRIYGEERRASSLDSSTVRRTLKQGADNAGDPKANVGITSSPIGFSQHLRDTSERNLCGCFSCCPMSRMAFPAPSGCVWTSGSQVVPFSGTRHASKTPAARSGRLSRMELQHPPWQRRRVGILYCSTHQRNVGVAIENTVGSLGSVLIAQVRRALKETQDGSHYSYD